MVTFRETGQRDNEAGALNGLGEAAHATDRATEALGYFTAAQVIAAEVGIREQEARALTGLGNAYCALDRLARAREHYQRALALYIDLGAPQADQVRARLRSFAKLTSCEG